MRLGTEVPGILTDKWLFVADDAHNIAQRVRDYDSESRLVAHAETHELAIARWVQASFCPGGAYIIAFKCFDPDTEEPIIGEPDARVLELLKRADTWRRRNPHRFYRATQKIIERREAHNRSLMHDRAAEIARRSVHKSKARHGIKDKAAMPGRTVSGLWIPGS